MKKLSQTDKFSVQEIAKELNLSTVVENGIRINFGDPISINELKQISRHQFMSCKNLGLKRWREFQNALSVFDVSEQSVSFINRPRANTLIVEIDLSKSFKEVIQDLFKIINNIV